MAYSIKELYFTLQGEGAHAGRPAVFLRFAGCNLWSGIEAERVNAVCNFCDTDFLGTNGPGGGKFASAEALAAAVAQLHPLSGERWVVCTGGAPLLQLDAPLIAALHSAGLRIAVETNGTLPVPEHIDWVCVSPKAGSTCVVQQGNELKLVYPQAGLNPADFASWNFEHFFLQPCDGPLREEHTQQVVEYCLHHAPWRVSLQLHKLLGIP